MSAKTTSERNWSRQIFIFFASLLVAGAFSVWFVNYDDIWKLRRHENESQPKIYATSLIYAPEFGKFLFRMYSFL